jgi:predicted kinase
MKPNSAAPLNLILLRGLPGAGKSTLAELLAAQRWPVFSVDAFFTDPVTKVYHFRYEDNHLAYKACQNNTEGAMVKKTELIIVDNTFTLEWEMSPYFELASRYQYRIHVLTVENRHGSGNSHGIAQEQIEKMAAKYKVQLF